MALRNYSSTSADATLSAGVTASATTLTVSATTGFPATPFILAVDAGASAQELVLVTNVAGTTLTVTRGYDSTIAAAHDTGAVVQHSHAAIDFREANAHVNATAAHGTTGSVVGTSDTQTLSNKTVNLSNNTLVGTRAQFNTAMSDDDFATLAGVETLTNKTLVAPAATGSLDSFGGAWATYTPSISGVTADNIVGRYARIGKTIHLRVGFRITGAPSGNITVEVPAATGTWFGAFGAVNGVGQITGLRTGTAYYLASAMFNTSTTLQFISSGSGIAWSAAEPTAWVNGDLFNVIATYEVA